MDVLLQLKQIAQERDLPVEELLIEIEEALAVAYKKFIGIPNDFDIDVRVEVGGPKGITASIAKEVVAEVTNPQYQIALTEALRRDSAKEIGDFVDVPVDPNSFGRIAATTFKQVLSQKMREAETRQINDQFHEKIGDVVTGHVSRREGQSVFVMVGKVETELPRREQVPTEPYRGNDRLIVFVLKVDDATRRMRVIVSRTHPGLLRKLFELHVPEIADGTVVIENVAREPGQRSKIAVRTTDERVDAVGACVGPRGSRVQSIVDDLYDEKIDIVPWSDDPKTYIEHALSPAKVNSIRLTTKVGEEGREERNAYCVVPDNQLSLAIGKGGQNVRLAARLTDWKIDIRSEHQAAEEAKQ